MNEDWARKVWDRKGFSGRFLWILFLPLSFLFCLGVRVRNLLYSLGCIPTRKLPCAVVSVGNLTVGGTGKTPTTLWLAEELGKRGYRVAILSRGYKRGGRKPTVLKPGFSRSASLGNGNHPKENPDEDPKAVGDEPAMMAGLFGQWVGVGKNRYEVGNQLLRDAPVDVFLLDDGFQHRRLRRDIDLLLLGSDSNGWLIPAGPFREPKSSLRRANLCLVTGAREAWKVELARYDEPPSIFFGVLQPKGLLTLDGDERKEHPIGILGRRKILTVSGIARPDSFRRMIHDWGGEIVGNMEFPDHHIYSAKDWQRITRAARSVDLIITTEKDILKLVRFPFAKEQLMALRVGMVVEEGDSLIQAVEDVIRGRMRGA
ncbi:MAG: tetraacyldisaccharide 4'-kinase [Candidatus Binatia bacterium]